MPTVADVENAARDEVKNRAVLKKFQTQPSLSELPLGTGDEEIVESAPGDHNWGCSKDGTGQNKLGQWCLAR